MLSDNPTLEEVASYFANDQFATRAAGCTVVEASRGHAVCEMKLTEIHRNATGNVMGGAIFTLADFALAIACNIGEPPSVSVSNTIEYFSATKGEKLIATCDVDKSGRRLGFYTVEITDDTGRRIAKMCATCAGERSPEPQRGEHRRAHRLHGAEQAARHGTHERDAVQIQREGRERSQNGDDGKDEPARRIECRHDDGTAPHGRCRPCDSRGNAPDCHASARRQEGSPHEHETFWVHDVNRNGKAVDKAPCKPRSRKRQARRVALRRDKEGCSQGKYKPQRLSCAWRLLCERARGKHDPHRTERLQHCGCTGIGAANRGDVGKLAGEEPEDTENDEAPKRGSIAQHRNKALAARRKQQH